jgi:hypothetical protein
VQIISMMSLLSSLLLKIMTIINIYFDSFGTSKIVSTLFDIVPHTLYNKISNQVLIEINKFNNLINILTFSSRLSSNS